MASISSIVAESWDTSLACDTSLYINANHALHSLENGGSFSGLVACSMEYDSWQDKASIFNCRTNGGPLLWVRIYISRHKDVLLVFSWITPVWENSAVCLFTWSRESPGDTEQSMYFSSLGKELLLSYYIRSFWINNSSNSFIHFVPCS